MVAGRADRVVADPVALVAGVQPEEALDPALAAPALDRRAQVGNDRLEAHLRRRDRVAHLLDLPLVLGHSQLREVCRERHVRLGDLLGHLDTGLGASLVDEGRDVTVGVTDDPQGDGAGVLGQRVGQVVDVACHEPELGFDVGQGRPRTNPELAVTGVGEELLGVAAGHRTEVEDGVVPAAVGLTAGVQHQDGIWLAVAPEAGEVGERGVRPEDVVGVVRPDLQAAGGDDQPFPGVCRAEGLTARRGIRRHLGPRGELGGAWCPPLAHEGAELLGGRPRAVVGLDLLFTRHPTNARMSVPNGNAGRVRLPGPAGARGLRRRGRG